MVYQARRRVLGDTHPETLRTLGLLGVIARDRKDLGRAEVLLRQAAALYEQVNGKAHPESIVIRNNYLAVVRDRGDVAAAVTGYAELLPLAETIFPAEATNLAVIRSNYGLSLARLRRFEAAEPLLIAGYRGLRKVLPADDPRLQVLRQRITQSYRDWGHPERLSEVLADPETQ